MTTTPLAQWKTDAIAKFNGLIAKYNQITKIELYNPNTDKTKNQKSTLWINGEVAMVDDHAVVSNMMDICQSAKVIKFVSQNPSQDRQGSFIEYKMA